MNAPIFSSSVQELLVQRDEDVREKVETFLLEKGWERAYICGAIGSVKDVTVTAPEGSSYPPKVGKTYCAGPGEILAFTGEIMKKEEMDPDLAGIYQEEGPYFIHIHASFAISGGHVYGGGFFRGKAFRCLKIYIQQR